MEDDHFDVFEDDDTQPIDMSQVFRDDEQIDDLLDGVPSDEKLFRILTEWSQEIKFGEPDPSVRAWQETMAAQASCYVYFSAPRPTIRSALRDLFHAAVLYPLARLVVAFPWPR